MEGHVPFLHSTCYAKQEEDGLDPQSRVSAVAAVKEDGEAQQGADQEKGKKKGGGSKLYLFGTYYVPVPTNMSSYVI